MITSTKITLEEATIPPAEINFMTEINFPAFYVHSGEYKRASIEMTNRIKAWETNHDIEMIADYVFSFWPAWFEQHVNSMDMMTAKTAVMHGYDPHTL